LSNLELVGPDGGPIPKKLSVRYGDRYYPYRVVSAEQLNDVKDPRLGMLGVLVQVGDQTNISWLALLALAKDIYSRQPEGTRHFQDFASELGLVIIDGKRQELSVAEELKKL
jgi:hypothetical protein